MHRCTESFTVVLGGRHENSNHPGRPGVQALAQEKSQITVKTSAVNNGVVIVTAQTGKTSFELQCNKDISGCRALEPGDYLMVRLPKNRGVYDCANVDIYPKSADSADPEVTEKLGEYCVTEQR
jgi:hypothetical protein